MRTKILVMFTFVGALFVAQHGVQAQQLDDNALLQGAYRFATTGQAQLTDATGNCAATGLVAAGLTDGLVIFDGRGNFFQDSVGISVGVTTCTSPNYHLSGVYNPLSAGQA